MGWERDWLKWTHVTYGLLQSVRLAESIDLGNLVKLQSNIESANKWFESHLGFSSVAERRKMRPGSIRINPEDSEQLLRVLRPSVLEMILLTTVSITEAILCDQLASSDVGSRPANLRQALDTLNKKLKDNDRLDNNGWAIQAMHEARILRNCIAHGSGVWSDEAVNQFADQFGRASLKPISGEPFTISVDDIFAYRRAAKTVLNESARLRTMSGSKNTRGFGPLPTKKGKGRRKPLHPR
jgi:hypothetical protein